MSEWQPIETAPKQGFILTTDGEDYWVAWWSCGSWAYATDYRGEDIDVDRVLSHWQHLPPLPST